MTIENNDSRNIFFEASRRKIRFPSKNGLLTVEDLWEIPLRSTSDAKASVENIGAELLARQSKLSGQSIFGTVSKSKDEVDLDLSIEILRTVARTRQEEADNKTLLLANKQKREKLEALISERRLKEASIEDLEKQLAAIN